MRKVFEIQSGPVNHDCKKVLFLLKCNRCNETLNVRKTKIKFRKVTRKYQPHYCFDSHYGIGDWDFNTTTQSLSWSQVWPHFSLYFGYFQTLPFEISDHYHFNLAIKGHIDNHGEFKLMTSSGLVYCYLSFLFVTVL